MSVGWWEPTDEGILLRVRVTPGSRHSEVVGAADGRLKVKLAARPVDGQANEELLRVIASWCGVRPSAVVLQRGATSRSKDLIVRGPAQPPNSPTL